MTLRLAWGLAIAAFAVLSASAAAAPVHGALDAATPMAIDGKTVVVGPHALFVAHGLVDDSSFRISASRVNVRYYEGSAPMIGGVSVEAGHQEVLLSERTYDAAEIEVSRPRTGAVLATYRPEGGGPAGLSEARLETSGPIAVHVQPPKATSTRYPHDIPHPHLATALRGGQVTITGDFDLYAHGLRVIVNGSHSPPHVYETGGDSPPSTPTVYRHRDRWVVVKLTAGSLTFQPGSVASTSVLHMERLMASVDGAAQLEDAKGRFATEVHVHEANHDTVLLGGNLVLNVTPVPASVSLLHLPGSDVPRLRASISGDLQHTNLRAVPVPGMGEDPPAGKAAVAVGAGALAGRFAWALYWRLNSEAALENPSRCRLLKVARTRPGLSLREAARAAGVSKTTGHYHLRVLAQLGFLLLTKDTPGSRVVRVFALDGDSSLASSPGARALTIALSREPCRKLARAIIARAAATGAAESAMSGRGSPPSMSLAELAQETGVPKPTALRHLRTLVRASVLEARGSPHSTRRYALTPTGLESLQGMSVLLTPTPPGTAPDGATTPPDETPA